MTTIFPKNQYTLTLSLFKILNISHMSIFFSLKISTHYLYLNISHTNIFFHIKLADTISIQIYLILIFFNFFAQAFGLPQLFTHFITISNSKRHFFFPLTLLKLLFCQFVYFCFYNFLLLSHSFNLFFIFISFHSSFGLHNFFLTSSLSFFSKMYVSFNNVEIIISLFVRCTFFFSHTRIHTCTCGHARAHVRTHTHTYIYVQILILHFFNLLFSISL